MTQYEKMGGTYTLQGDYRLPNLALPATEEREIGAWGQRHRWYIKAHHRIRYYNLLTTGALNSYLAYVETRAETMFEQLVKSLSEKESITEDLKIRYNKLRKFKNRKKEDKVCSLW